MPFLSSFHPFFHKFTLIFKVYTRLTLSFSPPFLPMFGTRCPLSIIRQTPQDFNAVFLFQQTTNKKPVTICDRFGLRLFPFWKQLSQIIFQNVRVRVLHSNIWSMTWRWGMYWPLMFLFWSWASLSMPQRSRAHFHGRPMRRRKEARLIQ